MVYVLIAYSNPGALSRMDEHLKKYFSLWISHIPGGLTPVAQMLDRTPNRHFKMVLHDKYNEWSLIQPQDSHGKIAAPSRAQVSRWGVEAWAEVTARMIARASVLTGTARVRDLCEIVWQVSNVCVLLRTPPTREH